MQPNEVDKFNAEWLVKQGYTPEHAHQFISRPTVRAKVARQSAKARTSGRKALRKSASSQEGK